MHWLIVKLGDKVVKNHRIEADSFTIGRAKDNAIVIENLSVSRNHARIERRGEEYVYTDLNSSNGSYVNGNRVSQVTLVPGDMISIGKYRLHFAVGADEAEASRGLEAGPPPQARPAAAPPAPGPRDSQIVLETVSKGDGELARKIATGEQAAAVTVKRGKQQGQAFLVGTDDVIIGRHGCEVRLHDISVGRNHAVIRLQDDHFLLRDLGSWNGTIVNGEKIRERRLNDGDEIIIGSTILEFRLAPSSEIKELKAASDRKRRVALATNDMVDVHQLRSENLVPESLAPESPAALKTQEDSGEIPASAIDEDFDSIRLSPEVTGGIPDTAPLPDSSPDFDDDEFAPMTEEELAALEEEADDAFLQLDDEAIRQAEWEQIEADRMMREGGGMDANRAGALIDPHDQEESAHIRPPGPGEEPLALEDEADAEELVHLEEQALFRGPVKDVDANDEPAVDDSVSVTPEALARTAPVERTSSGEIPRESSDNVRVPDGVDPKEYKRWMRGLKNKSKVVRREAARKLKELTGIDYDWESDPE